MRAGRKFLDDVEFPTTRVPHKVLTYPSIFITLPTLMNHISKKISKSIKSRDFDSFKCCRLFLLSCSGLAISVGIIHFDIKFEKF